MVNLEKLSGKYLTFNLGDETYGIEILKVQEIIGMMKVTHFPKSPDFVRGVINLRGKVIPVIDLREKFGMETVDDTEKTCIVVVQIGDVKEGLIVDEVSEVVDVQESQLEEAPSFGAASVDMDFIIGVAKIEEKVIILLEVEKILTEEEYEDISSIEED